MKKTKTPGADMRWFRLYHGALHDDKVQELRPDLFKFWVNLLCLASSYEPRGRLPAKDSTIAFQCHMPTPKAAEALQKLEAAGLIDREDDGTRVMHDWDEWQPASDNGAARQKAFRNRHRNAKRNVTGDVTEDVTVTPRAREEQEHAAHAEQEASLRKQKQNAPPPPYPSDDDLLTIRSGTHDHPQADAEKFFADVWQAFGSLKLCEGWYEFQQAHSLPAWRAAFAEARRRGKAFSSIGFVEKIAHDFDDKGNKRRSSGGGSSDNGAFDPDPDAEAKQIAEAAKRRYGGQPNA